MAWRAWGAPDGAPWLVLHGGPGSGARPGLLAPLESGRHRAFIPDQRGSGASRPRGSVRANHTVALVADLELLRRHSGVARWSILAGSWGAVLALAYAHRHPERVQRIVLRGAFALRRREVGRLLLPNRQTLQRLGADFAWPLQHGTPLPVALRRLTRMLQIATTTVAPLRVTRCWDVLETGLAERGLRRSERLARHGGDVALAVAIHREWAALHRRWRLGRARSRHRQRLRSDQQALRTYRIQAHYLFHRGFLRAGELDRAVCGLVRRGVEIYWVHGLCDTVCFPVNSRRWAAVGGRLVQPLAGHLSHEPAMISALRAVVGSPF